MKRPPRIRWILGGLMSAGLILVLGLSSSLVQTAIARRVLADQPGMESSLGALKVGLNSVEVRNLSIRQGSVSIQLPMVKLEGALWGWLSKPRRFDRLQAHDWSVTWDGTRQTETQPAVPVTAAGWTAILATLEKEKTPPEGWLEPLSELLATPFPFSVGEIDLAGRAAWREAGPGADGQAEVRLRGEGPAAGESHALRLEVSAMGTQASARGIQSLDISSDVVFALNADARPVSIAVATRLKASGEGSLEQKDYGLTVRVEQSQGLPQMQIVLSELDRELFQAELAADQTANLMRGRWQVAINDASVRSLMLGVDVPEFSLEGAGGLSAANTLDEITVDGDVTFKLRRIAQYAEGLAGIGDLSGQVGFEVLQTAGDTRVTRMEFALDGVRPVLKARLLQGIEFGHDAAEFRVAEPADPVIECRLLGLPLAWLQPQIAPWVVDARPLQGDLIGMVTPQGVRLMTNAPLRIEGAALAAKGTTYVDDIDVEIDLSSEITTEGWQVELGRVEIMTAADTLLNLQARAGRLQRDDDVVKVVGKVEADLAAFAGLPRLSRYSSLQQGMLRAEFGLGLEDRLSVATAVTIDNLVDQSGQALPEVGLDGRVDWRPDGSLELHLPVQVSRARRTSEMTFNFRAQPQDTEWEFEGSVVGQKIHVVDFQAFEGLLTEPEPAGSITTSHSPGFGPLSLVQVRGADWAGLQGSFQLAVSEVVLPDAPSLTRLRGRMVLDPEFLLLESLDLEVGATGQLAVNGRVEFDETPVSTYRGAATVEATQVEIEPWLRWMEPETTPVLAGMVNLSAAWEASSSALADLPSAGLFTAHVSSSGGVIRALGVDVEASIKTGQTVATLGALFGAVTGNQQIAQKAQLVQSASNAAAQLAAVSFDQLNLNVDRVASGDIVISDLALISPAVRLIGDGRITYRAGVDFWLQPLALKLNLSARDELGQALQQLGLLRDSQDSLGYLPLIRDFTLDGSLADIGTNQLEQLFRRALQ